MDELTAPLGQSVPPRRRVSVPRAIAIALAVALFGVGMWMALTKHPFRDTPVAVSPAPQQVGRIHPWCRLGSRRIRLAEFGNPPAAASVLSPSSTG